MREKIRREDQDELVKLNGVIVIGIEVIHDLLKFVLAQPDLEFTEDRQHFLNDSVVTYLLMLPLLSLSKSSKTFLKLSMSKSRNFSIIITL